MKGYFRGKVCKLNETFPNAPEVANELDSRRNYFYNKIDQKVDEYEINNLKTDCPEMKKFIKEIESDINEEFTNIINKYKKADNTEPMK